MMLIYLLLRNGLFQECFKMGVNPLKCLAGLGFLDRTNSCFIGVIQKSFVFVISLDGKKSRLKMINDPFAEDGIVSCQCCGSGEYLYNEDGNQNGYCGNCGARIDWPEDDNKRWRKVSSETPYVSPSVMCSDDVEVKFKDGHTSVGFISFDGRWFDHDCDEIKRPDCWRPLEDNN